MDVLIVDNDLDDSAIYKKILLSFDNTHKVKVVNDGMEALSLLHSSDYRPDLVLLDHDLPRMFCLTFLKKLRMDPDLKNLFVVVLSTVCSDQHLNQFQSLGAACRIKPAAFGEMEDLFSRILESARGQRPELDQ